jgi:hypothetical protein
VAESLKNPACKAWRGVDDQRSPTDPSDTIVLAAIEQAFDAVWLVICDREPARDKVRTGELATELSRKLVALVADGVTDPAELKRLVLDSLPLLLAARG